MMNNDNSTIPTTTTTTTTTTINVDNNNSNNNNDSAILNDIFGDSSSQVQSPTVRETLQTIMQDGKIVAGRQMVFTYHAEDFYATVLADGNLSYKNKVFTSLSGFGSYCITLWQERRGGLEAHTNKKKTVDGWLGVRYINENNERIMMDKLRRFPKSGGNRGGHKRSSALPKKPEESKFYTIRKIGEYLQEVVNHDPRTLDELAAALKFELPYVIKAVQYMVTTKRTLGFNLKILNKDSKRNATVEDLNDENDGGKVLLQYDSMYKNIRSKEDILNLLNNSGNNSKEEILVNDLSTSYSKCRQDVASLIRSGQIIGLHAEKQKNTVLSRPLQYFSQLPGKIFVRRGSRFVETTMDLRADLRRGDCIRICSEEDFEKNTGVYNAEYENSIYRLSRASKTTSYNASSMSYRLSATCPIEYKKGILELPNYQFPFNASVLSLDRPYIGKPYNSGNGISIYKMGVSNEIRRAWVDMTSSNWPQDEQAMMEKLQEKGIVTDIYSDEPVNNNNTNNNRKKSKKKDRRRTRKRKKY